MAGHPFLIVDKSAFYRFAVSAPEDRHCEFVRGRIFRQPKADTLTHSRIGRKFASIIEAELDLDNWFACNGGGPGVETASTIRYPDMVLERTGAPGDSLATSEAVVIVEVLSESSGERDLEAKPAEYLSLPSLEAYIVASQDEPVCQVWLRGADGTFPAQPATVEGRDQVIHIPAPSVAIPLAEVYRGIGS